MGTSLTFSDAVFGTRDRLRMRTCRDPICRLHMRHLAIQLDHVCSKLSHLENCVVDPVYRGHMSRYISLCWLIIIFPV